MRRITRGTARRTALIGLLSVSPVASATQATPADVANGSDGSRETGPLVDFAAPHETARWRAVNDGVMGGRSQGRLVSESDTTAVFEGVLSLENRGGFASVRRSPAECHLTEAAGIVVDVRGDGRTYQLRLRTDDAFDGPAYRALFATRPDEWQRIVLPFSSFDATWRGRSIPNAPPLDPAEVRQIGVLLADEQPGAFRLEIRSIGPWAPAGDDAVQAVPR